MADLPTFDELYELAKVEVQARNPRLTDFEEGSNLDAITGAGAMLADEVIRIVVSRFRRHFVDTAEGDDLDALVWDRLRMKRKEATGAIGVVTWTKGDPGASYTIPAGFILRGTYLGETIEVATTAAVAVASSDSEVDLPCQVINRVGRDSSFPDGVIDTVAAPHTADPGATVTNSDRFVGGRDRESDNELRARFRRFFEALRRGTVGALEMGALSVPGVSYVTVDEGTIRCGDGGFVRVYVGDPDANSNVTLAAQVVAELEHWRAAGILVVVDGAEREEIPLHVTLFIRAGANRGAIAEAVRASVLGYTDDLAPKETLRISRVHKHAHDAHADVLGAQVTTPAGDTVPAAPHHALRVRPEDIAFTFVEV